MNARTLRLGVPAALMLALAACAGTPAKIEDPHHYSKDRDGNRVACYTTETGNEYECVPVVRYYPRSYDPFWDPWLYGFAYAWPHYYGTRVIYYPVYRDAPPPSRRPRR
jgi:hypothetical protein